MSVGFPHGLHSRYHEHHSQWLPVLTETHTLEIITGITPDISEYLDFHFYEWVQVNTNAGLGPSQLG